MHGKDRTRKHFRVASTAEEPITVSFRQPELKKLESRIEVRDVSVEGLGLKVPLGARELKEGMVIEGMEIGLPGAAKCVLTGAVVYKRLGHCGIRFVESDSAETRKLRAFTSLKEKEQA